MKTKSLLGCIIILFCLQGYGQSFQSRTMLQQIAALRVYGEYLQKGYGVVSNGLNAIGDIKNGEFTLHSDYFISLTNVNPSIANSEIVAKTIDLQLEVLRIASEIPTSSSSYFLPEETAHFSKAKERLLKSCFEEMERLYSILTDNGLAMQDAERIVALSDVHGEMQGNYAFAVAFRDTISLLQRDRERSLREAVKSKQLYNLTD